MIKIGDYNNLKVTREVDFGLYLADNENSEVLIPKKYIPHGTKIGDTMTVFVYKDSEDRKVATTITPKAKVGEFALMKVKDINKIGAFLDWGLEKDMMLPFGEYDKDLCVGDNIFVYVALDPITERIIATTKLNKYTEKDNIGLLIDEEVDLQICKITFLGANAIINNKYMGLIYQDELHGKIDIGDKLVGYVKKIRKEDNKIDISLRKPGFDEVVAAKDKIIKRMKFNNGFLALSDDSDPERIREELGMSKKTFKKAVGGLYKERIIELTKTGIKFR